MSPHLHDEALVVAAARLRDQLILEPAPLLVQLHHRVLPVLRQDWSLLLHVLQAERGWMSPTKSPAHTELLPNLFG